MSSLVGVRRKDFGGNLAGESWGDLEGDLLSREETSLFFPVAAAAVATAAWLLFPWDTCVLVLLLLLLRCEKWAELATTEELASLKLS